MNLLQDLRWELAIVSVLMFLFGFDQDTGDLHPETAGFVIISLILARRVFIARDSFSSDNPFEKFKWELTVAILMLLTFSLDLMSTSPLYGYGLLILSLLLARRIRFRDRPGGDAHSSDKISPPSP